MNASLQLMTTAFVLGGGGMLGAHEVGMLRALREAGVRPDVIVGTSIGAVNDARDNARDSAGEDAGSSPIIVFSRHAGPGDSLLLVHHLLSVCGRRPRLVMKAALQLDPSLDVLANRLPNAFIQHRHKKRIAKDGTKDGTKGGTKDGTKGGTKGQEAAGAEPRRHTDQIKRLAAGLDENSALVIFPEGANWTPLRWRRAIARLRRRGLKSLAERAAAMPNVLAPRTRGALAAMAACPDADVIFVAHAGLDRLVSVRDVCRACRPMCR